MLIKKYGNVHINQHGNIPGQVDGKEKEHIKGQTLRHIKHNITEVNKIFEQISKYSNMG